MSTETTDDDAEVVDAFACFAMQALIARGDYPVAQEAYSIAEDMLAERKRRHAAVTAEVKESK